MKKISLIIVSAMLFMSSMAFAAEVQTTAAVSISPTNANMRVQAKLGLKEEIKKAREYKKELISNVKKGVLSKEDARKRWAEKIAELRAKKEAFFQARIKRLEVKKEKLNEVAPEIAKKIEERLKIIKERRERIAKIRAELRADIKSGKVDRSELKKRVQTVRKEIKAKRDSFLKAFKIQRVNIRDEFRKRIAKKREMMKEVRKEKGLQLGGLKADLKNQINTRHIKAKEIKAIKMDAKNKFGGIKANLQQNPDYIRKMKEIQAKKMRGQMEIKATSGSISTKGGFAVGGFNAD